MSLVGPGALLGVALEEWQRCFSWSDVLVIVYRWTVNGDFERDKLFEP